MATYDNLHSRVVAWLKIVLPLAALGILSTLFLVARGIDTSEELPFAEINLKERARSQQITKPSFAGASPSGDLIAVTANSARPEAQGENRLLASGIEARIDFKSGRTIQFRADDGLIDLPGDETTLSGGVIITTSDQYRIETASLITGMRHVRAESTGEITGNGPPGRFTAGKMVLRTDADNSNAQLVFTDGVKLVYDPARPKD